MINNKQTNHFILPHKQPLWSQKKNILQQALLKQTLLDALNLINKIPKSFAKWQPQTYSLKQSQHTLLLLKWIISKALQIQNLFHNDIPISQPLPPLQSAKSYILLNKLQCCSLVANMFLCTIDPQKNMHEMPPYFTFSYLSKSYNQITKTLLVYFEKIKKYQQTNPSLLTNSNIIYLRMLQHKTLEDWLSQQSPLCEVRYHQKGAIEDLESEIQIDFANKSIGGFFLRHTFTQEDIIFINSPQLMPALLFHEYMKDDESILMIGAQRVATYTGYLETYQFAAEYFDERPLVSVKIQEVIIKNVRDSWISAIDAIPSFAGKEFTQKFTIRQLNKAFCGFNIQKIDGCKKSISTGNWGSGAFDGNLQYKFLLQWIAASASGRSVDYFSFDDKRAFKIPKIIKMCEGLKTGELVKIIMQLSEKFTEKRQIFSSLCSYIQDTRKQQQ